MAVALFGTDGARGRANEELTPLLAMDIGRAAGTELWSGSRVVVGRDTRVSGPMLEAAVTAGLASAGVEVVSLGIAPTPAVAALVPLLKADAGVVISASHNPPEYNGIKLLQADGRKWASEREAAVERRVNAADFRKAAPAATGGTRHWPEAVEQYRSRLVGWFAGRVPPLKAVVDLGHGAAIATAVPVLERLGVECIMLYSEPEGRLINQACGATHPGIVADAVKRYGADVGLSFDGDADRLMAADETGQILDGDAVMYVLASGMQQRGELAGSPVVATVMSNLGLERGLHARGIDLLRTPVGDRWVADKMRESGAVLGGEQSGHVILSRWAVTGDGLLTALALLAELGSGEKLSGKLEGFTRYPQLLKNVRLTAPLKNWEDVPGLTEEARRCEADLGTEGRLLIRPSGTERLLRIMLEGRDADQLAEWADRLVAVVQETLTPEAVSPQD
jgi:phosphoglucosamine mutase